MRCEIPGCQSRVAKPKDDKSPPLCDPHLSAFSLSPLSRRWLHRGDHRSEIALAAWWRMTDAEARVTAK